MAQVAGEASQGPQAAKGGAELVARDRFIETLCARPRDVSEPRPKRRATSREAMLAQGSEAAAAAAVAAADAEGDEAAAARARQALAEAEEEAAMLEEEERERLEEEAAWESAQSRAKEAEESARLQVAYERWRESDEGQAAAKQRASLPVQMMEASLRSTMLSSQVAIVCGETGSGKSTQVPQMLLEHNLLAGKGGATSILCTQPRRIAATSLARRVASERCERVGERGSLVGYQVRLESKRCESTRLLFCTTGIALRMMLSEPLLEGISHVVVDEVHERDTQTDQLLLCCASSCPHAPTSRSTHVGDRPPTSRKVFRRLRHPHLQRTHLPGRGALPRACAPAHPPHALPDSQSCCARAPTGKRPPSPCTTAPSRRVAAGGGNRRRSDQPRVLRRTVRRVWRGRVLQRSYNEHVVNPELIEDVLHYIDDNYDEGAVLVFLPGLSDITGLLNSLSGSRRFGDRSAFRVLPLHSSLSPAEQAEVFEAMPPGVRKIVLATNIAETSITIDDAVFVIDTGRAKQMLFNEQKQMRRLVDVWISQAEARQRAGRAGRVRAGVVFKLYTRHRAMVHMSPSRPPEMLRGPLAEICLQLRLAPLLHDTPLRVAFEKALTPPPVAAAATAILGLQRTAALDEAERLTPLGRHRPPSPWTLGLDGFCSTAASSAAPTPSC